MPTQCFAEPLIAATGADPALAPLSATYMRIRALAAPAVLTIMVLQSGLLAQQDSTSPALVTVGSVLLSVLGNLVAVAWLGMGLTGAAATTVLTQLAGAGALLLVSRRAGALTPRLAVPSLGELAAFGSTMGPLGITYVCKVRPSNRSRVPGCREGASRGAGHYVGTH